MFVLLTRDALPAAAAAALTSPHPVTSHDVTFPIITLSTPDSELADVAETFPTAELPQPSDWLPTFESSSALANHGCDLLSLQLVDVNDNCIAVDPSLQTPTYSDLHWRDGTATSDDDLLEDLIVQGRCSPVSLTCLFSLLLC